MSDIEVVKKIAQYVHLKQKLPPKINGCSKELFDEQVSDMIDNKVICKGTAHTLSPSDKIFRKGVNIDFIPIEKHESSECILIDNQKYKEVYGMSIYDK